jgi:hypothetical protein
MSKRAGLFVRINGVVKTASGCFTEANPAMDICKELTIDIRNLKTEIDNNETTIQAYCDQGVPLGADGLGYLERLEAVTDGLTEELHGLQESLEYMAAGGSNQPVEEGGG